MPYSLDNKLVIAVASSALFELAESDRMYRKEGTMRIAGISVSIKLRLYLQA